jgi:tetratricopeptide (TPR) repeat protein
MARMFRNARVRATCLLSFFLATVLIAYGQPAKPSIASIESLIHAQQYDQALQLTASALRDHPSDSRLWTIQGIILSIQGKNREALTAFDKALRLSPNNPAALRGEVQILYQSQSPSDAKRAIPLLRQIVQSDPKDQTAHEMLAMLERKQGDCQAAIEQFHLIADTIQDHPDSLEAYGGCLAATEQPSYAIPVFERLATLLPQSSYPAYDLAVVLIEAKQNAAALKVLEPLLAARPSDPDLLSLASEAYEAVGNTPKAVDLLRQAIVLNPKNPNYYVAFAALCLAHSSFDVGIDMVNAGLQRIPNDPSLYLSRGLLYAQLAKYDQAESDFNTAERLDSAQSLSSYALDLAEIEKNQGDKALSNIRLQLKTHPESPWLHYALARLLDDKTAGVDSNSYQEAVQSAQEAVRLKPDFIEARNLLANMYLHADKYEDAIQQSRLVLQTDPSNQSAMYHLLIALRRSGKPGQSEEIQTLATRLAELQQSSFHKEVENTRYKLVEQQPTPPK